MDSLCKLGRPVSPDCGHSLGSTSGEHGFKLPYYPVLGSPLMSVPGLGDLLSDSRSDAASFSSGRITSIAASRLFKQGTQSSFPFW